MKPSPKFFVTIPVKPYVKRYLEINYGSPVNFEEHISEQKFLLSLLQKRNQRFDYLYPQEMTKYTAFVEVLISRDDFMRHGFELTKTGIVEFGRRHEGTIKAISKMYIQFKKGFSNLKDSVIDFQKLFNVEDDHWDYESIKKEIARHGQKPDIDFRDVLNKSFNEYFLKNVMQEEKKRKLMTKKGYFHYLERL